MRACPAAKGWRCAGSAFVGRMECKFSHAAQLACKHHTNQPTSQPLQLQPQPHPLMLPHRTHLRLLPAKLVGCHGRRKLCDHQATAGASGDLELAPPPPPLGILNSQRNVGQRGGPGVAVAVDVRGGACAILCGSRGRRVDWRWDRWDSSSTRRATKTCKSSFDGSTTQDWCACTAHTMPAVLNCSPASNRCSP